MRRFLTLVCLLGLALPAGISISGCVRNPAGNYCNGLGYGPTVTQVANITLQPQIAGISLAYGQTTQVQSPARHHLQGRPGISLRVPNQLRHLQQSTGRPLAQRRYLRRHLEPKQRRRHRRLHLLQLPQSLAFDRRSALRHCLYHRDGRFGHFQSSHGLHPRPDFQHQLGDHAARWRACTGLLLAEPAGQPRRAGVLQLQWSADSPLRSGFANTLPECSSSIGTLNFATGNTAVATIDSATNVITAQQPGTTVITATIAQTASSAGYFSTCPPKSISLALANGSTKGVVTQGVAQNLTTTVTDTLGNTITGLTLTYESTNPIDIFRGRHHQSVFPRRRYVNRALQTAGLQPSSHQRAWFERDRIAHRLQPSRHHCSRHHQ